MTISVNLRYGELFVTVDSDEPYQPDILNDLKSRAVATFAEALDVVQHADTDKLLAVLQLTNDNEDDGTAE